MFPKSLSVWPVCAIVVAAAAVAGCGSDDAPVYYSQALFRIEAQGGGACARLDHVASARVRHELEPQRIFVLQDGESRTMLLANGPPPYRARFDWVSEGCPDTSGQILASGFEVQGPQAEERVLDADHPTATLQLRADVPGGVSNQTETPRVRFEVCAPLSSADDCSDGIAGRIFTGIIGDARASHILSVLEGNDAATTPAILFLERPRDQASGQFQGAARQLLRAELYVNDRRESVSVSTTNVVVSDDL